MFAHRTYSGMFADVARGGVDVGLDFGRFDDYTYYYLNYSPQGDDLGRLYCNRDWSDPSLYFGVVDEKRKKMNNFQAIVRVLVVLLSVNLLREVSFFRNLASCMILELSIL